LLCIFVVVQDNVSCEEKMQALLDTADYKLLLKDPTKSVEKIIATAIKQSKKFDAKTIILLTPQFSKAPHIYSLIKEHKTSFPITPIVSGIDSPTQRLAKYLLPVLNPLVRKTIVREKLGGFYTKNY
jgi:hypothetical protein